MSDMPKEIWLYDPDNFDTDPEECWIWGTQNPLHVTNYYEKYIRADQSDARHAELQEQRDELLEALEAACDVIDELIPDAPDPACDIELINKGCIKINKAVKKAIGGS